MQSKNSAAVVGVFTDLDQAQKAVKVLREENIGTSVRLIENDFSDEFESRRDDSRSDRTTDLQGGERKGGISGFFSRLFGFDDDQSDVRLNSDSELYFKDSYQNKHHFVIIDNPQDPLRGRQLLTSFGAIIEDRGNELYQRERFQSARADQTMTQNRDMAQTSQPVEGEAVMELREEELNITKQRVQTGEVHLRKEIVEEMKTVEVPVTREEVVIETRPLTGAAREGSLGEIDASDNREIRIPVSEEQVFVEKKVVPREEVRVSKEEVVEQRVISEELKREEARLEEEGHINVSANERSKMKSKGKSKIAPDEHQPGA